jgi:hypothetical protein
LFQRRRGLREAGLGLSEVWRVVGTRIAAGLAIFSGKFEGANQRAWILGADVEV